MMIMERKEKFMIDLLNSFQSFTIIENSGISIFSFAQFFFLYPMMIMMSTNWRRLSIDQQVKREREKRSIDFCYNNLMMHLFFLWSIDYQSIHVLVSHTHSQYVYTHEKLFIIIVVDIHWLSYTAIINNIFVYWID